MKESDVLKSKSEKWAENGCPALAVHSDDTMDSVFLGFMFPVFVAAQLESGIPSYLSAAR